MEAPDYCYPFLYFIIQVTLIGASNSCAPGLKTAGVTVPRGDINIEYGNPIEIFCMLNTPTKYNSSNLRFYHDKFEVSKELLNIVNETTLRLYVEKPPISTYYYYCKLMTTSNELEGVCFNIVNVGTKPQEVQNFSCISYNWDSLNCSWVPVYNPIKTKYKINFVIKAKHRMLHHCPDDSDKNRNFCFWNEKTDPIYRKPYEEYSFKLTGTNGIDTLVKQYTINHYGVVLPRKPENLSLVNATSSSLTISWVIPVTLRTFPPGIKNKVMYQSKWDSSNYWKEVDTSFVSNRSEKRVLNITGLKYAHTVYDIRVLLKSGKAKDEEKWWSEPATITLRTKPTVPGNPPKTDVGSFESKVQETYRNIYIYWQQIPACEENGEHFEYKILRIEELVGSEWIERNVTPAAITKTYALFKMMSFNRYNFTIASSNKEGISRETANVVVPSKHQSPAEPVFLKKIAYEHGVYELSWNAPPHSYNITSYTIFWCDNKNDRPYQCNGYLNWTRVSSNITEKNITLPANKIFQFAISANSYNFSSSGMHWADCTVLPDQERGKLKNIWINGIGATYMELSWKLECLQVREITGFDVSYCPISDPQDLSCKEPLQNLFYKGDQTTSHARIEPLRPYTTYKVYLAVVSNKGIGLKSDPLLNTTLEAAPSGPPENVRVIEVTNTSITVSWNPPLFLNGVLKDYVIYWNNDSSRVKDKSPVVTKKIINLSSFEEYRIKVSACTVHCSTLSDTLIVKTKIGKPGQVLAPTVNSYNLTELNITWSPLEDRRGGNVDYYDIKIEIMDEGGTIISKRFYNKSESTYDTGTFEILTPGCSFSDTARPAQFFYVFVRAVNIGTNGDILLGPWSQPTKGVCFLNKKSLSVKTIIFLVVVGVLILIFMCTIIGYLIKCVWRRYKAMQNIRVKLPPQLELDIYKDKVNDIPITAHVCSSQHKPNSNDTNEMPPPDQQLLLEKKYKEELVESSTEDCEDVNADRESSGCGSGHESVSSSITAGTHITDSGTEADEIPPSPDVFSDSPRRLSDLRQRNVSGSGSGGDGYSRLAQVPSGYVTLPPVSRGVYVKHDWTPNPPSKTYDIAGSLTSPNTNPARPHSNEASWTS